MSTINKNRMGFISVSLKLANMRNEQDFTIYPYNGGDFLTIQSNKRIAKINLKNGEGVINGKNEQNGAYFHHLSFGNVKSFNLDKTTLTNLQKYFWENEGENGGGSVISWENKELFSN
jgi:hypothetical protein